jgi:hypothetical protein
VAIEKRGASLRPARHPSGPKALAAESALQKGKELTKKSFSSPYGFDGIFSDEGKNDGADEDDEPCVMWDTGTMTSNRKISA